MSFFSYIKDKIWFKFCLDSNEFSKKLDIDFKQLLGKTKEEQHRYIKDIVKARDKAHRIDAGL